MLWFLTDTARLERERASVDALAVEVDWIENVYWRLEGARIVMDCDIASSSDSRVALTTSFPEHFPSTPPSVRPQEPARLSSHQYGLDGELCLEIGPDNWHCDKHSAADLLRSAHRLLRDESARNDDDDVVIPTRHALTEGQELRGKLVRFVLTPSAEAALRGLDDDWVVARFTVMFHKQSWTVFLARLERPGQDAWVCEQLPKDLKQFGLHSLGIVCGAPQGPLTAAVFSSADLLTGHLQRADLPTPEGEDQPLSHERIEYVLVKRGKEWGLIFRWDNLEKLLYCATLRADTAPPTERIGPDAEVLVDKAVAILGLGSAGSKVATSLARAGVGRFVLIDDDVLHPSNLVRHDSDWSQVGQHKVDAVADRLSLINPKTVVKRHRVRLLGQESSSTAAGAVTSLGHADLIIDATANPEVFNLCAHVAREAKKPLLWLEIFGGGFGGLIARTRPEKDAEPFTLRQAIRDAASRITTETGAEKPTIATDYAATAADGPPLVATDADVAVVAHLSTQLALDTLVAREPSQYPYPAYFLGLRRAWIFDQPLQVYPVDADTMGSWTSAVSDENPETQAGRAFLFTLFEEFGQRADD